MIHTDQYTIAAYEIGPNRKLRIQNFFNFLQHTAWQHARILGFGYKDVAQDGLAWVLSQVEAHILRYPEWDEEISLSTWPSGKFHFLYTRDFLMKDKKGEVIAKATSTWMLIDLKDRRPKHYDKLDKMQHTFPVERSIDAMPMRIKPKGIEEKVLEVDAGFSKLDPNKHVNTSYYIEWALDALPDATKFLKDGSCIAVNFLKEVVQGDQLEIFRRTDEDDVLIRGSKKEAGQDVFTMKFFWMD